MTAAAVTVLERPILFSGPMVRAILQDRKTQTRRVVTSLSGRRANRVVERPGADYTAGGVRAHYPCPYGRAGDQLWVRETWQRGFRRAGASDPEFLFRADLKDGQQYLGVDVWRPSIHMPRCASRLTLELTAVRVERVQDISEDDAIAEGVDACCVRHVHFDGGAYRCEYQHVWDALNDKRGFGWFANPWVWVLQFRRRV